MMMTNLKTVVPAFSAITVSFDIIIIFSLHDLSLLPLQTLQVSLVTNTPYEGLNLANQKSRKLEGSHSLFHCYFDKY